ncbi:hypothetical protein V1506DRAFT_549106 [Lipomyces tetrasporus]
MNSSADCLVAPDTTAVSISLALASRALRYAIRCSGICTLANGGLMSSLTICAIFASGFRQNFIFIHICIHIFGLVSSFWDSLTVVSFIAVAC